MLEISFKNETNIQMQVWEDQARILIQSIIEKLKIKIKTTLTISFIDKATALKLNKEYRSETYVPDVISFSSGVSYKTAKQLHFYELGDLFICFDVAKEKAKHYNHDLTTEMAFLFVHGTLHLLGYDHEKFWDKKKMFRLQDKILKQNHINYVVIEDRLDYL